jgi:hypothetical protein
MPSTKPARWTAVLRAVFVAGLALGTIACGAGAERPAASPRGRSPESVAAVTPGARADAYGVSIAGASSPENGYMVDGLNVGKGGADRSVEAAAAPPAPPLSSTGARPPTPPSSVADAPHSAAMLIYTASLGLAVFQVNEAMDAVERIGRETGGYLASRGDNAITIRVPRDRFDDAIGRIERLGDVVHRDIKAEDVTDQYVDLQARLKNAYAMRDQLLELLRRANVKEAIEIQTELGHVTEQIEVMEGKLKLLRDQIAFSTITVQFAPVAAQDVHDTSLLAPFPWLQDLGLQRLLDVNP